MKVTKLGDGLAIQLSAELVERLGLKEGDDVEVHRVSKPEGCAVEVERKPSIDELFERIRQMEPKLPADYKFKREDAYDDY